ncbi:MAG: hypothetical protein P1V97_08615 [Planctomycetota bacterium]|nr:hypothetical protein [Planctomycetota bacterium]
MIGVGIDEAGYGPTLGPLVVTSSSFQFKEPRNLWQALAPTSRQERKGKPYTIWIDDSKKIKKGKNGKEQLETGVLAFYLTRAPFPENFGDFLLGCDVDLKRYENLPWYADLMERKLPLFGWKGEVIEHGRRVEKALAKAEIEFRGFVTHPVNAREFNEGIIKTNNKATFHLGNFKYLVSSVLKREPLDEDIYFVCDKLGGRDKYSRVLGELFPGRVITIKEEGSKQSHYSIGDGKRTVEVRFMQKADSKSMAVALSSMLCKYIREIFVEQFNKHFQAQKPGLKATAGYPQDARRYLDDIQDLVENLSVPKEWLIRSR